MIQLATGCSDSDITSLAGVAPDLGGGGVGAGGGGRQEGRQVGRRAGRHAGEQQRRCTEVEDLRVS